jgi:hypothetical protein
MSSFSYCRNNLNVLFHLHVGVPENAVKTTALYVITIITTTTFQLSFKKHNSTPPSQPKPPHSQPD